MTGHDQCVILLCVMSLLFVARIPTLPVDGFADPPNAQGLLGPHAARYRAASLTRAAMLYRRALKRGEVPAEGTKDTPFCMDTYRFVLSPIWTACLFTSNPGGCSTVRVFREPRVSTGVCPTPKRATLAATGMWSWSATAISGGLTLLGVGAFSARLSLRSKSIVSVIHTLHASNPVRSNASSPHRRLDLLALAR